MAIFLDSDDFLPGTITEIESDYSLGYSRGDFGSTESVLLFGTAFNGPVGRPVPIYNPEHGEYMFGKAYDATTRREASLTPAIKDAYDRGARHIYGVRISGEHVFKDFMLASSSRLRLRVSGTNPSNNCKDCYFRLDKSVVGSAELTLYKPISFATISEKEQGLVDEISNQIPVLFDIEQSYGLSANSKLVELIKILNEHTRNNALHLGIIDSEGNDITHTSADAQALTIEDMLPGTYFIGRDKNKKENAEAKIKYNIDSKTNKVIKEIVSNNDVRSDYPISDDGISQARPGSTLRNAYLIDQLFGKDAHDYEKVELNSFELYKTLGSGYATTASLTSIDDGQGGKKYKVVQTPDEDAEKVVPINDGIYSVLENMNAQNRVLTCGFADQNLKGILPKVDDFKFLKRFEATILDESLNLKSKIDEALKIKVINEADPIAFEMEDIDVDNVYPVLVDDADTKDGEIFILKDNNGISLKEKVGGTVEDVTSIAKDYVLGMFNENVYIYKNENGVLTPEVDFKSFVNKSPIASCSLPLDDGSIELTIKIFDAELITLAELIQETEINDVIDEHVTITLAQKGLQNEEAYVGDILTGTEEVDIEAAKEVVDESLKIPYTTTDNLARQLAQHCTYTSLKTSPTKGFISISKMNSVELEAVAQNVDRIMEKDFELYAKKPNGRNMLDKNNLPYHIGRNISVTFMQYPVYMDDGYTYISNGAAGYAGMVSSLPLDQSSTNQPFNIPLATFTLSNHQLVRLTKRGYITCKDSFTKGIVITDGITMALNDSAYKRLSTLRTIGAVDDLIREATEPYIGKKNNIANRNALTTAIKSRLNMIQDILIDKYDFDLMYDPRTAKFGNIDIDYVIVPIYEIRTVRNRISIRDTI